MSKRRRNKFQSDDEEDTEIVPTTAEDRLTNILLQKLFKRGLLVKSPDASTAFEDSNSPPAPSTARSLASIPDVPPTTVPVTVHAETPSGTTAPSVFAVEATQLFKGPELQPPTSSMGEGWLISSHISEKLKRTFGQTSS
ncbi:hypothetical protein SNE40_018305 [Patella caerulea]|uniref:Uncharacterized protein n=1 Tax=Patella caerulea TaxID=87958 RepID=A0AAN8P6Y6_PATCE